MFESRLDQAQGLRRMFGRRDLRVLPLAIDVGDAQQCNFVVNLAGGLARIGRRTLLLDGDRASIAPSLGLKLRYDLQHVISGEFSLFDVARRAADGFWVLPAARALARIVSDGASPGALFEGFARMPEPFDTILLTAHADMLAPLMAQEGKETALVSGTDAQALASAYARVKALCHNYGFSEFRVFYNRAASTAAAADCHERLASAADRFLGAQVHFGGSVEQENALTLAERAKSTIFSIAGDSQAARSFERIATRSLEWPVPVFGAAQAVLH